MSVYKDEKTNTWRVVYRTKDWMGTVKQTQKRGFRTKKEALNWEMEQKLKDTTDLDMKFETFAEIYKDGIRVRLKESSMQLKEYLLDTKITPYFANLSMNEIKPRHVVAWQNEMLRGRTEKGEKYSPVYLKTLHNQLSAVFNYAVKFYELRDNPDLFPFEYYDAQSKGYQGILPELYKQISQSSGLEFVYIHPGIMNQQGRLAKNCQVELVSAYIRGQIEATDGECIVRRVDADTEICIAFTAVTPDEIKAEIRSAIENLTDKQIMELAVRIPKPLPEQKLYWWSGLICGTLVLVVLVLSAVLFHQRKSGKKNNETRFVDSLTGIGNELYFENTFKHCVKQTNFPLYYLVYISLDVQRIEQYLGIIKAEEIQRYAADILSQTASDEDFIARSGDGVFLIALQAPTNEAASIRVSEILDQLNRYEGTFLEEHRVLFRAGVFWIDTANMSVETAVFNARQGYNAAAQNGCSFVFVDKDLLNSEATKLELQRKLSDAFVEGEFLLYMQMIVNRNGKIIGAEALSRWQNRDKGLLTPAVFIEPLKSAGLIDKMDFYILEEACRQLEQWSLTDKEHLWMSCNFTRLTISRNDFAERFKNVLSKYQFSHSCLIIELTEDSLMNNTTVAYRNILECKKMGCKIALDDLGSGYSSLQDLCDYPIDIIKIDRHIVSKSTTLKGNALLQGLIELGHDLGMEVLCEGVESEMDKQRVCKAGCDYIQGFYYSRVLPKDEANLFYERNQTSLGDHL